MLGWFYRTEEAAVRLRSVYLKAGLTDGFLSRHRLNLLVEELLSKALFRAVATQKIVFLRLFTTFIY